MQEVYLCLDVGGTEIKAAPLDKRGNFLAPVRHFPAMAGADRQTLLEKSLVGFLAVSARKMLFPLKLILRFPDRLTIKRHLPFTRAGQIRCTVRLQSAPEHSPKSAACWSEKIQFINDAAAFAFGGNGLWSGDASRASSVCSSGNRLRQCIWGERISG